MIGAYKNGNYMVQIYENGTKMRVTKEYEFKPIFPESIDLKITNQCNMECPYCHENSTPDGEHADLSAAFIDSLHPYTEIAIGGGNPLAHPGLEDFLTKLKEKRIIANITIHQRHFMQEYDTIKRWYEAKLIHGIGVSVNSVHNPDLIYWLKSIPTIVCHIIAGVCPVGVIDTLSGEGLNLLILGYKDLRRGHAFKSTKVEENIEQLAANILDLKDHFKYIAFDNLAIQQLKMKSKIDSEIWDSVYMGDDGQFTMYIDLVNKQFAQSSTSLSRYEIGDNINDMFKRIQYDIDFSKRYNFEMGM